MWLVFGTKVNARRVPGGRKVERVCGHCGEKATFYEREVTSTFNLYFIDVFDYRRHRVMACGCCGTCYATDELGVPETRSFEAPARPALQEQAERVTGQVGAYVDRAASAVEGVVSRLFFDEHPASAEPEEAAPPRDEDDPLADPLEARFRELERKARIRID